MGGTPGIRLSSGTVENERAGGNTKAGLLTRAETCGKTSRARLKSVIRPRFGQLPIVALLLAEHIGSLVTA